MGGSQLKKFKATLKENGLTGQTNSKGKNRKDKAISNSRRNDKEETLKNIRQEFNQFDGKIEKRKHPVTSIEGGQLVNGGTKPITNVTKKKSAMENMLKMQYEVNKNRKGKTGGIIDKRFGERNKNMSMEEKMLQRFTAERQKNSNKKIDFALGSEEEEDDDEDNFVLTHSGKALALDDEADETDIYQDNANNIGDNSTNYVDEDQALAEQVPHRKSKKEVMQEIISKSKFYKHQRQVQNQKVKDDVMDLDEDFGEVMQEFNTATANGSKNATRARTQEEIDYDAKVRQLIYDRRAAPAERTKSEEELREEEETRKKKLEQERSLRMDGEIDGNVPQGDDLDDFWQGSESDEEKGFTVNKSESNAEESEEEVSDGESLGANKVRNKRSSSRLPTIVCPSSVEEFEGTMESLDKHHRLSHIENIVEAYHPRLAEGNKDRMNKFVGILFEYILRESEKGAAKVDMINEMVLLVKKLSELYNQALVEVARQKVNEVHSRVRRLTVADLVLFAMIGDLFSTSDHYHLIVTPSLIVMNEILFTLEHKEKLGFSEIGQGIFVIEVLLLYQRLSKRFLPEAINFIGNVLPKLLPEPEKYDSKVKFDPDTNVELDTWAQGDHLGPLRLGEIFGKSSGHRKAALLDRLVDDVERIINLWKDKSALIEIMLLLKPPLIHLLQYSGSDKVLPLLEKMEKLSQNANRTPLTLQLHRSIAIPSLVPKFEENFNPDVKSYDPNPERKELSKLKHELKKEKKGALKDIRKASKFAAGQQIEEKKHYYDDYHRKMAKIINSINTEEGAEKNAYDRLKKL